MAAGTGWTSRAVARYGTVMARFASVDATWGAYVNSFGPVVVVAAGLDAVRREDMRQAFNA